MAEATHRRRRRRAPAHRDYGVFRDGTVIRITHPRQVREIFRSLVALAEKPDCGATLDRVGAIIAEVCVPLDGLEESVEEMVFSV